MLKVSTPRAEAWIVARRCSVGLAALIVASLAAVGVAKALIRNTGGRDCTPVQVHMRDGSLRTMLAPPIPGVSVRAVSPHRVRFDWRFRVQPRKCAPASLLLTVQPGDSRYTPFGGMVRVTSAHGTYIINLPSFYVRSNTALASASTRKGLRTPVIRLRIRG